MWRRPSKLKAVDHLGGGFRMGSTGSQTAKFSTLTLGALSSSSRRGGSILGLPNSDVRPERLYGLLLSKPKKEKN